MSCRSSSEVARGIRLPRGEPRPRGHAIELDEDVALLDDIALANVDLDDARCETAPDVDVDTFDDAAAARRPVLGRAKMADAEHQGNDEPCGE